ncbi:hypothetical protein GPOL_c26680 [Gordonia polyisoprenivorans VH2]|uniref:Uncharacterized protein n=1 Tax=Gordonia polyisoprenivorans (strain DSM 44266 / VH2) TaxID=1112204 RepID=H6MQZ2_GORPV|nr:hypothetical protein GPOL_c26680 [Gordonia polyisoprenivorans VH2]
MGRFAGSGTKVTNAASAAKSATTASVRKAARSAGSKASDAYVSGSFTKNLEIGQGGDYKGVKVGAEFRTPKGRGALVKGIVGYHGKPDRRVDVTPTLDKPAKKVTVTAKPNPASKSAAAGRKVRR